VDELVVADGDRDRIALGALTGDVDARVRRVEVRREALSIARAARIFAKMVWGGIVGRYGPQRR